MKRGLSEGFITFNPPLLPRIQGCSKIYILIIILSTFTLPWLGHAPGLPTELKPTLHTALVQVATDTGVVG